VYVVLAEVADPRLVGVLEDLDHMVWDAHAFRVVPLLTGSYRKH
jgi:hypothetical protein